MEEALLGKFIRIIFAHIATWKSTATKSYRRMAKFMIDDIFRV